MTNEHEHYQPTRREHVVWLAWAVAACVTLTARAIVGQLARRRPTWQPLLAAFVVVGVRVAWAAPVTVGPVAVEAAGEVAPTADARLQGGYALPAEAQPEAPAEPGGAVLETAAGIFGPLDDGAPPSWLSRELAPYWGSIAAAAHEVGLDSHWLGIVAMVENPQAITAIVTFDGGHGLAQIQSATASLIQAESGLPCVNGWADPATSYRCGAWYLRGAVMDGADLVRDGDAEPALLMGVAGYNSGHDSAIVGTLRRALSSGASDPCASIGNQYTRRYCYSARDMWAGSLAERGTMPAAPTPAYVPPVAPGGPTHLEASAP